jgi:Immunity protein 26
MKVNYREGDWFAVPLRNGGFAVGVIARANPRGVSLGYFFGPPRSDVPRLDEVADLRSGDAVLVRKFGHLGILNGR